VHVPNSITVVFLLFIKSQFTTTAQKCPAPDSSHAWTYVIVEYRRVPKVRRWLRIIWHAKNMRWWSVYSFSVRTEYARGLKCPHRQKCEDGGLVNVGGKGGAFTSKIKCLLILLPTYFLILASTTPEVCPSILDTPCIATLSAVQTVRRWMVGW
jgi:hypothetical protein